ENERAADARGSNSIRVQVNTLEQLMTAVSELVLTRKIDPQQFQRVSKGNFCRVTVRVTEFLRSFRSTYRRKPGSALRIAYSLFRSAAAFSQFSLDETRLDTRGCCCGSIHVTRRRNGISQLDKFCP